MDPKEIKLENIIAKEPKYIKKNNSFRYITIPLVTEEEKKVILLLKDQRLKIFESDYTGDKTYSVGITLSDTLLEIMKELEKHLRSLAMKNKKKVKELAPSFSNFTEEDFNLIKIDKSEKEKIYGKLYLTKGKINSPFYQLTLKDGKKKKKKINPHDYISFPLKGDIAIELNQIFCGSIKSLTCVVKETLIKEIVQAPSLFDEYEDEDDEGEAYENEDEKD